MKYRKDIKGIHFYTEGLEFPVAIYEKTDWDHTQIGYLDVLKHTTRSLIQWCKNHQIDWDILYPLSKLSPIKHPIRHVLPLSCHPDHLLEGLITPLREYCKHFITECICYC